MVLAGPKQYLHSQRRASIMRVSQEAQQQVIVSDTVDVGGVWPEDVGCDTAALSRKAR